ncbi:hypothetical protein [Pseudoalteromonas fuliginea]|uniref:hypothetical protein n=1 Tax=Pseudoalteromonas fuliginea TaxID=1872678 RepID=UPI00317DFB51
MYINEHWGGKREGAGRPRKISKKPVRISEREEYLLLILRQHNLLDEFIKQAMIKTNIGT